MRINHNISSMITQGTLKRVNRGMSKSLQKLSTGLRINAAADDAAGLGVSENLRTQVKGMSQAMKNTQDAIAMLNIADGALNEQADILQRMRELTIQAKNETYTDTERAYIGQEISSLVDELDRIAGATNYNGMRLFAAPEFVEGEGATVYSSSDSNGDPRSIADARMLWDDPAENVMGATDRGSAHYFNMMIGANYSQQDIDASNQNGSRISWDKNSANMMTIQFSQMDANALLSFNPASQTGNASAVFDNLGWDPNIAGDQQDFFLSIAYHGAPDQGSVQTKLDHLLNVIDGNTEDVPDHLLLKGLSIEQNKSGLDRINHMRGYIGATINRLEHTVNNLVNQQTNTQAAESLIRDADFAHEAAKLTKNQILSQSATSMLAQSNMVPQGVLQLLG